MLEISTVVFHDPIDPSSMVQSRHSSNLTTNSQMYSRDSRRSNYYYEIMEIKVFEDGIYHLVSESTIDTYGSIYQDTFHPVLPCVNLITQDDDGTCDKQFMVNLYFRAITTYILVVTTHSPNVTGSFSIVAFGPNNVILKRSSEYIWYLLHNE